MTRADLRRLLWRFSVLAFACLSFAFVSGSLVSTLGDAYLRAYGGKAHARAVGCVETPNGHPIVTYKFVVDGRPHRFELSPLGERRPLFDYLPRLPGVARPRQSEPADLFWAAFSALLGLACAKASHERWRKGPEARRIGSGRP